MINYAAFDTKHSFISVARYSWKDSDITGRGVIVVVSVIYALFSVPYVLAFFQQFATLQASGSMDIALIIPQLIPLILVIAIPAVIAALVISSNRRKMRISQFCADNQFDFQFSGGSGGGKKGNLFNRGHSRSVRNKISGVYSNCDFSVYDYQYSEGTGKYRRTYSFGVAEMTLERHLPHILVDNKRDGSVGGFEFDRSQILKLEGNFNNFFTVYGPKEYEIEVLQVLNPSVMSSMLDMHESFDIEIIGDKMFIYNRGMTKKPAFQAIFHAMEQLSTSTKSVQSSFTMPQQIGDDKPVLKRSRRPIVVIVIFLLIVMIIQLIT